MRLAAAAGKAHDSTSFRNAPANRSMFDIAHEGDVAILRMAHGKANAMNIELCSALSQYLAEFRTSQARALVITGTGGIFSAGVDLLRLSEGGASYVRKFLPALNAMFAATFSIPYADRRRDQRPRHRRRLCAGLRGRQTADGA